MRCLAVATLIVASALPAVAKSEKECVHRLYAATGDGKQYFLEVQGVPDAFLVLPDGAKIGYAVSLTNRTGAVSLMALDPPLDRFTDDFVFAADGSFTIPDLEKTLDRPIAPGLVWKFLRCNDMTRG